METQHTAYEKDLQLKSERFDVDALGEYNLYLSVGEDGLRLAVIDSRNNECVALEHYRFFSRLPLIELIANLGYIYESHLFLKANFWKKILITVRGEAFTLVPDDFFEEAQTAKYLKPVTMIGENKLVFTCPQKSIASQNIFLAEKEIVEWFKEVIYPASPSFFIHQSTALIEGVLRGKTDSFPSQLHIHVENNYMIVLAVRNKVLELCNSFKFKTAQDFVYYVLFVMDELKLDPLSCKLNLYGNINTNSAVFSLLFRYIKDIVFNNETASHLRLSPAFEKAPLYKYLDLLAMHYIEI